MKLYWRKMGRHRQKYWDMHFSMQKFHVSLFVKVPQKLLSRFLNTATRLRSSRGVKKSVGGRANQVGKWFQALQFEKFVPAVSKRF